MINQNNQPNRQLPEDNLQINISDDSDSDIHAPFEFSLFERVEAGFDNPNRDYASSMPVSKKSKNSSDKFIGPKQIIFISGWIDIRSIYQNYKECFYIRIFIGIILLYCLLRNNQNFLPLILFATLASFLYLIRYSYNLLINKKSHKRIKFIGWVELQLSLGYFIIFFGFTLVYTSYLSISYLPIFVLPYFIITFLIFMFKPEENAFLAQKNYCLIESFQFVLISIKILDPQIMNWNITLVLFMASAIYMTTLGLLLSVILSCSLFGFLYQDLEKWKLKSLIWMTTYYLFTGINYVYIVKGLIEFFDDDNVITRERIQCYIYYTSNDSEILASAAMMMVVFNLVFFFMHIFWKKDIIKYLSRIIFKKDLRKEVSLRKFKESFTFKVIQFSAVFFKRNNMKNLKENKHAKKLATEDDCIVCYSAIPNIMQEPCGHGGMCKECCLEYLKNEQKCMICRKNVKRLIVIEQDKETLNFHATAQIKLVI